MIKSLSLLIGVLLLFAFIVGAQDTESETTPEVTGEATSEVTPEATAVPEGTPEAEATEDPECPALVSTALELTQNRCEGTNINQACYGFVMIESETRPGGDVLERPGDRASISDILSLQLSCLDTST